MKFTISKTGRGFSHIAFTDRYNVKCSLQKSSIGTEDCIWLGVNDANPQIMASDALHLGIETEHRTGHIPFTFPKEVSFDTRMHLTREQVSALIPLLQTFVDTGELP